MGRPLGAAGISGLMTRAPTFRNLLFNRLH